MDSETEKPKLRHSAVIFDRDGTLIETEEGLAKARAETVRKFLDRTITPELNEATKGKGAKGIFSYYLKELGGDPSLLDQMVGSFRASLTKIYITEGVKPIPGAVDLVKRLKNEGLRLAIGTGASKNSATLLLNLAGFNSSDFEVVVTGDSVISQKPSPETFLSAAGRLHLAPFQCVVIGDAQNDLTAARFAGIPTIYYNPNGREEIKQNTATVTSLSRINNKLIQSL